MRKLSSSTLRLLAGVVLLFPGVALGQGRRESERPSAFGTASLTLSTVMASGCQNVIGDSVLAGEINGYRWKNGGGSGFVDCSFDLPSGARIDSFEVVAHDSSDTSEVIGSLGVCPTIDVGTACNGYGTVSTTGTAAAPFTGYLFSNVSGSGLVVDKFNNAYYVRVVLQAADETTRFRQVNVYYRRQISTPAPGTQTFGDVPEAHVYYRAIEALAASGITSGCGGGNFCPNGTVTRGEMAAFLARALGLHFPN